MRWIWGAALACCAAACTQTFGLDSARDDDRDADHIPDASDNCPDVYNPDQSSHLGSGQPGDACQVCMASDPKDSDGDGIPDACDACDNRLPDDNHNGVPDACEHPHDEDGDGIPDLFDNCPSVFNPDQLDVGDVGTGDGPALMPDGVGDACDDSPFRDGQVFDSFAEKNQLWVSTGMWRDGDDHATAPIDAGGAFRFAGIGLSIFDVSTAVTIVGDGGVGIVALDSSSPPYQVSCGIYATSGQYYLELTETVNTAIVASAMPIAITPTFPAPVKAEFFYPTANVWTYQEVHCTAGGQTTKINAITSPATSWHPGLGAEPDSGTPNAQGSATFEYYDQITTLP
jgi:hypothetical protein